MVRWSPAGAGCRTVGTVVAMLAVAGACSSGGSTDEPDSTTASVADEEVVDTSVLDAAELEEAVELVAAEDTLVWVAAAEPADLNLDANINGLAEAVWIREGRLESLFGVSSNLTHHPELLETDPAVTVAGDGTVTIEYRLRSDLRWSDGTPLTSDDVAYTHRILTEGCEVEFDGSIVDASRNFLFQFSDYRHQRFVLPNMLISVDTSSL